jgi:hypothetical protein
MARLAKSRLFFGMISRIGTPQPEINLKIASCHEIFTRVSQNRHADKTLT